METAGSHFAQGLLVFTALAMRSSASVTQDKTYLSKAPNWKPGVGAS